MVPAWFGSYRILMSSSKFKFKITRCFLVNDVSTHRIDIEPGSRYSLGTRARSPPPSGYIPAWCMLYDSGCSSRARKASRGYREPGQNRGIKLLYLMILVEELFSHCKRRYKKRNGVCVGCLWYYSLSKFSISKHFESKTLFVLEVITCQPHLFDVSNWFLGWPSDPR